MDIELKGRSTKWKNWECTFSDNTCIDCIEKHGEIFPIFEIVKLMHIFCRCRIVPMRTIIAGKTTQDGICGVDVYIKYTGKLPINYVTKESALRAGWIPKKGNLSQVLPGKTIGGNIYNNFDKKLPEGNNRIWYEADFDYDSGYRNDNRILYSSDGLIFISYDHYETFYEIT